MSNYIESLEKLEAALRNKSGKDIDFFLTNYQESDIRGVLSSIPRPLVIKEFKDFLDRSLELQSPLFGVFLQELFSQEHLKDFPNALFFAKYISGPVLQAIKGSGDLCCRTVEASKHVIQNHSGHTGKYFFIDDIDPENHEKNKQLGLWTKTKYDGISQFTSINRKSFFQQIKNSNDIEGLMRCWNAGDNIQKSSYRIAVAVIYHAFENDLFDKGNNRYADGRRFKWEVSSFLDSAYKYYSDLAKAGNSDALETCHHIAWLILRYFANDPEEGLFRPYSQTDKQLLEICKDYILFAPQEHLSVFVMHHRDSEYSKWVKYGLKYDGRELAGGGYSGFGTEIELDDNPFVQLLLEPVLQSIYEKALTDQDIVGFIDFLYQKFLRLDQGTSSLYPVLFKRASVPILIQILKDGKIDKKKVFDSLSKLIVITDGIPPLSSKCFSEFLKQKDNKDFYLEQGMDILQLIKQNIDSSLLKIPNEFAFRVLLRLGKYDLSEAKDFIKNLFKNKYFFQYDSFSYDILANIRDELGIDSDEMSFAVETFLSSPEWREKCSGYSSYAVVDYLKRKGTSLTSLKSLLNSGDPNLQKIVPDLLEKDSESDPVGALQHTSELLGKDPPHQVFTETQFIPSILENYFKLMSDERWETCHDSIQLAIDLCDLLTNDPNPQPVDEYHKKILNGEVDLGITTTRGYLAFTVRHLGCSKEYFKEAWFLTKKLLSDDNLHVVCQAFYSLYEILRRRKWNPEVSEDALTYLWKFFNKEQLSNAIESQVLNCFQTVRDLNEDDAERVLRRFSHLKHVENLFVFYTIYRQSVVEWGDFDSLRFRNLLEEVIRNNQSDLALRILRTFRHCITDDPNVIDQILPLLKLYKEQALASKEIINSGFDAVKAIFKHGKENSIPEAIQLFNEFIDIEHSYLISIKEAGYFHHYPAIFELFYDYSPSEFYNILLKVGKNVAISKEWFDTREIHKILLSENNPVYSNMVMEFLDYTVIANPHAYKFRSDWIKQAQEKGLIKKTEGTT